MDRTAFEKKVFSILREIGITPKGFYRYPDFSELIGQQKPNWPLRTSLKVMIEILYVKTQKEHVTGFLKTARDNQVSRSIIFGIEDLENMQQEEIDLMKNNDIDYFGPTSINDLINEKSITSENIQDYQKASEVVGAKRLTDGLDNLAHQKIPTDIIQSVQAIKNSEKIPAWNIFEEAVYAAFKHCIGYYVRQLGKEKLFQEEPEGIAIIENDGRKAFLYECKSAKEFYTMTMDHKRAYVNYIKTKKKEIDAIDNAELRYFVIIGPEFRGDIENRRKQILQETGVLVVYLKAELLTLIAQWACDIDSKIKSLIDLSELFSEVSDNEVTKEKVNSFIKKFDQKYKTRY